MRMPRSFANCPWRIIPNTTVSKQTQLYDVILLQPAYLQHCGGNCCRQWRNCHPLYNLFIHWRRLGLSDSEFWPSNLFF